MSEPIYRKKSLDNLKTPEDLNQYIQVANPTSWILLSAILCILLGAIVWGVFGKIETTIPVQVVVKDETASCNVSPEELSKISSGMVIRIKETTGTVWEINNKNMSVLSKIKIEDGFYSAEIVTEVIKPMSLFFN